MIDPRAQFARQFEDTFLDAQRLIGDPPADEALKQMLELEGQLSAKQFFDKLIREVELPVDLLPPPLKAFVDQHQELPDWADLEKIKMAEALFIDHGPKFLVFLYFKSLPTLYSCVNGAQILVKTGRLAHDPASKQIFTRRIAETGQFLLQVMAPGHLRSGGKAINFILKVRLIHAAIRLFIQNGEWDTHELGVPINQEDMALTALSFGLMTLEGLAQFGIEEKEELKEAYIHHWSVVGHLLGIHQALLPENYPRAAYLKKEILARQSGPSEAGAILTQALLDFSEQSLKLQTLQKGPKVLMYYLIGQKMAADLGIAYQPGCLYPFVPLFIKRFFNWQERLEDRSEPLHILINVIAQELAERMVDYFNEYKGAKFQVPESLNWKVEDRS